MTHAEIEEGQIADRYVLGQLTGEELARFEEHYLSCAECLDRLEATAGLAAALKRVAAADVARAAAVRQLSVVAWLGRLGRSRQAAVLLPVLLLAVLLPALALYRGARLDRQLRAARSAAAAAARQGADLDAARANLARERQAHAELAGELARARAPQAGVPVLSLGAERGGEGNGKGGPTYRLRLPRLPGTVVLSLPVEPTSGGLAWQVVLSRAGGPEIWRSAPLAIREDTLAIAVPSRLLVPGDHVVAIESAKPAPGGRAAAPAARFLFRVLPPLAP